LGFYLLFAAFSLEMVRLAYKDLTDGSPMHPFAPMIKTAIVGVVFAYPNLYTIMVSAFLIAPIKALSGSIAPDAGTVWENFTLSASEAIYSNTGGKWSLIKAILTLSFGGLLSSVAFIVMFAIVYAIMVVQKILWAVLFIAGPIFGPFFIFAPTSGFYKQWLRAILSISLWALMTAILIKVFTVVGLSTLVQSSFVGGDQNIFHVIAISCGMIFMSLQIPSLTGQLFSFNFSSPLTPGRLFGTMGAGAFGLAQLGVITALKTSPLLGKKLSTAMNRAPKPLKDAWDKMQSKANGEEKPGLAKKRTPEVFKPDPGFAKKGPLSSSAFKDKLLNKGRNLSDLKKNLATMKMVNAKTSKIQRGLFRGMASKFALARNPFTPMVNRMFFGGIPVTDGVGWLLRGGKNRFELTNSLVTPRQFSRVKSKEEYLSLLDHLKHFDPLSKDKKLTLLKNLQEKGYSMGEITQSMEILDHNFKKFERLEDMEGMAQKVMDINAKTDFENIVNQGFKESSDSEVWRFFKANEAFKDIKREEMIALFKAFSPAFVMASAQHLMTNSKSITRNNGLFILKSFLGKNKVYDGFSKDPHLGINRFVSAASDVKTQKQLRSKVRKLTLFRYLSNEEIDSISAGRSMQDIAVIADFANTTLEKQAVENPYGVLNGLVTSFYNEMEEKGKPFHSAAAFLQKADKSFVEEKGYKALLNKYDANAVRSAVQVVKNVKRTFQKPRVGLFVKQAGRDRQKELIKTAITKNVFKGTTPERAGEILKAFVNAPPGYFESVPEPQMRVFRDESLPAFEAGTEKETAIAFDEFTAVGGFDQGTAVEAAHVFNELKTLESPITKDSVKKTQAKILRPREGSNVKVFKKTDSPAFKRYFVSSFAQAGGFDKVPLNQAVKTLGYLRHHNFKVDDMTEKSISMAKAQAFEVSSQGFVDHSPNESFETQSAPQIDPFAKSGTIEKQTFIEKFVDKGGFEDTAPERAVEVMHFMKQENLSPEDLTENDISVLKGFEYTPDATGKLYKQENRDSQNKQDNLERVSQYLDDHFEPQKGYEVKTKEVVGYVSRHVNDAFGLKNFETAIATPPATALKVLKEIQEHVSLSRFDGEELANAVNSITTGNNDIGSFAQAKSLDCRIEQVEKEISTMEAFNDVNPNFIEGFADMASPRELSQWAAEFNDEVAGFEGINPVADFSLFVEEKLKEKTK